MEPAMEKSRQTIILHKFYLAYGAGAFLLYCLLMAFIFPWWQASNHPILFTLDAGLDTPMELVFEDDGSLPLAPLGEGTNHFKKWGTELPPRPRYTLSLRFPEGSVNPVVLSSIDLVDLSPRKNLIPLDLSDLEARTNDSTSVIKRPNGWVISAEPGGELQLVENFPKTGLGEWLLDALSATTVYILVSGLVLMLLASGLRFPDRVTAKSHVSTRSENVVLWGGLILGAMLHLHMVANSMPDYWPADSTSYTMKSVSLVTDGSYDTGTHEYELNRMPGFPVFMAVVFKIAGWDMNAVSYAQALCFCLSVLALASSLRGFLSGWLIGIGSFMALMSPAAIWASRQIATESTFASTWILATAAFIFLWRNSGTRRYLGWLLFGIAATAAVSIRPNGILLFAMPGLLSIGTLWWAVSIRGWGFWRIPVLWKTAWQVAIPGSMVLLFIVVWSWRNYESRGYPKPTDLTEVVWANAPFFSGIFDIRAAADADEYRWFVNERATSGYWFHGWSLRKYRFRKITNQYQDIQDKSIAELESELARFNAVSSQLIPLQAKLAGWGRVAGWGLFFPEIGAYTTDSLNQNYRVSTTFSNENLQNRIRNNLRWATRNVDKEIQLRTVESDSWIRIYNKWIVPHYPWLYRLLFLGALVGWACALAERKYLVVALITPYLANIFLNVYFMYIIGRYVQVLDASLWFTVIAGLSCLGKNGLQGSVSENDRQNVPPIKPKRLLTRFARLPVSPQLTRERA